MEELRSFAVNQILRKKKLSKNNNLIPIYIDKRDKKRDQHGSAVLLNHKRPCRIIFFNLNELIALLIVFYYNL